MADTISKIKLGGTTYDIVASNTLTSDDLLNYVTKEELETHEEIAVAAFASLNNKISNLDLSIFELVTTLPTSDIKENKIYLVPSSVTGTDNIYTEYKRVNDAWEKLGEYKSDVDLSEYAKKSDIPTTLPANGGTANKAKVLNNYYDSRPTTANATFTEVGGLKTFVATSSMTEGKPTQGDSHILHMSWDTSSLWDALLAVSGTPSSTGMLIRNKNNGTWQDWATVLTSNNYETYISNYAANNLLQRVADWHGSYNCQGDYYWHFADITYNTGWYFTEGIFRFDSRNNPPFHLYVKVSTGADAFTDNNIEAFIYDTTGTYAKCYYVPVITETSVVYQLYIQHKTCDAINYLLMHKHNFYPNNSIINLYDDVVDNRITELPVGAVEIAKKNEFVSLSGDTMTGQLLIATGNPTGNKGLKIGNTILTSDAGELTFYNSIIRFTSGTNYDYNKWAGLAYDDSTKTIKLGIADGTNFLANNAQSDGKLLLPGIRELKLENINSSWPLSLKFHSTPGEGLDWISEIATDYWGNNYNTTTGWTHGMYFVSGRQGFDNFIFLKNDKTPLFKIDKTGGFVATGESTINDNKVLHTGAQTLTDDEKTLVKSNLGIPTSYAPTNAELNVQSDWNLTNTSADDYIKNKPTIPTIPDWVTESEPSYVKFTELTLTDAEKTLVKTNLGISNRPNFSINSLNFTVGSELSSTILPNYLDFELSYTWHDIECKTEAVYNPSSRIKIFKLKGVKWRSDTNVADIVDFYVYACSYYSSALGNYWRVGKIGFTFSSLGNYGSNEYTFFDFQTENLVSSSTGISTSYMMNFIRAIPSTLKLIISNENFNWGYFSGAIFIHSGTLSQITITSPTKSVTYNEEEIHKFTVGDSGCTVSIPTGFWTVGNFDSLEADKSYILIIKADTVIIHEIEIR